MADGGRADDPARARRPPSGCASPRAPRRRRAAAARPGAGARASSCPSREDRRGAGCGSLRRRSRARGGRAPGRERRRGPGRHEAAARSGSEPRTAAARTRLGGTRLPARDGCNATGSIACERRLRCRVGGAEEPLEAPTPCAFGRREHASDRTDAPVERELADRGVPVEALWRDLPRSGEHGQRDRQVEARSLLAETGRREVDRDPVPRPLERRGGDARAHAVLRLLARAVGEADDREARQAALDVRLDLHPARVEADESVGDRAREHRSTVDRQPERHCVETAPSRAVGSARVSG